MLYDIAQTMDVIIHPGFIPLPDSPADQELTAARKEPSTSAADTWDERPCRAAYALAIMNFAAALRYANSMAQLIPGGDAASVIALARALVEAASQTWWLCEPGIGVRRRVMRMAALRHRGAINGEQAAHNDGVAEHDYSRYTETISQVTAWAAELGLPKQAKEGYAYVCGGERLPSASRRVADMLANLDIPSLYNLYSAYPHGEIFALRRGFEVIDDGHGFHVRPIPDEEGLRGAVAVAGFTLAPSSARHWFE
jgi:Family of unknown function (DUF5677)